MSDQPCPGNCNSRWRKAQDAYRKALAAYDPLDAATSRPEEPDTSLVREWGAPVWCTEHTSDIRLHLAQLDDLAAIYHQAADGHRGAPVTQRVGGATVVLSASEAHDDLDDLTSVLTAWEREYRDRMGWPAAPPRGELATVQTSCIAWLGQHLDEILACEVAEGFGKAVLQWQPSMAGKARAGQRTLLLEARCRCGQRMLTWKEGTDRVECANRDCQRIMSKSAYDDLAADQAEEHKRLYHRGRECNCHLRRASLLA
jgi:hypothetical protein